MQARKQGVKVQMLTRSGIRLDRPRPCRSRRSRAPAHRKLHPRRRSRRARRRTAPPTSPTFRPPSRKAPRTPSPTSASTSSTSKATAPATSRCSNAKPCSPTSSSPPTTPGSQFSEHMESNGAQMFQIRLRAARRRHHLQKIATRQVRRRPQRRLAQIQVPPRAGVRRRRLHPARQIENRRPTASAPSSSATTTPTPKPAATSSTPAAPAPASTRSSPSPCASARNRRNQHQPLLQRPARRPQRGHLGSPLHSRPGPLRHLDRRRPGPPGSLPRPPRRQALVSEVRREMAAPTPKSNQNKTSNPSADVPHERAPASDPGPLPHPPIRLTHPEKILDPTSRLTKQQLADFYWAVAPRMLPHIAGRALSPRPPAQRHRRRKLLPEERHHHPAPRLRLRPRPRQKDRRNPPVRHPRHPRSHRRPGPDVGPRSPPLGLARRRPRASRPPRHRPRP